MSYKSAEKKFYEKHYDNSITLDPEKLNLNKVFKDKFSAGSRYYLIEKLINKLHRRDNLLELGCGYGETLIYMSSKYEFNKSVGIDIAYKEPKIFKEGKIEFINKNLNDKFPFKDGEFDLIVAMMLIEHLFDPFHAFQEISRILSSDGICFINLPLVTSIRNRMRLLFGILPTTSVPHAQWIRDLEWDGNHLHYFSINSIQMLCKLNNLKIIDMRCVGPYYKFKDLFPSFLAGEITFAVQKNKLR
jgi:SAM-dependent methyltransferase